MRFYLYTTAAKVTCLSLTAPHAREMKSSVAVMKAPMSNFTSLIVGRHPRHETPPWLHSFS